MLPGFRAICFGLILSVPLAAHAQMPTITPPPQPGTIRVQVTLGGPIAIGGLSSDDVKKMEMDARVKIYASARNECAALSDTLDAECRLVTLTVSAIPQFGSIPSVNVSGTAVYQLTPRKPTP